MNSRSEASSSTTSTCCSGIDLSYHRNGEGDARAALPTLQPNPAAVSLYETTADRQTQPGARRPRLPGVVQSNEGLDAPPVNREGRHIRRDVDSQPVAHRWVGVGLSRFDELGEGPFLADDVEAPAFDAGEVEQGVDQVAQG